MIRNVLLPEKIGNYYVFGKRILSFDIGKTHVNAVQVYLNARSITVEHYFQEPLEGNNVAYTEKVSKAITAIVQKADKKCAIYTALPSSVVVFKTLKLPFTDREKISMVIGYEIEPLLPFTLHDAIVDFIITKEFPQESSAEILVAAVQKNQVMQHLQYFTQAGLEPEKISLDMFDIFALYKKIPAYATKLGGVALIDLGFNSTRIAYVYDGQLRMVRTLSKGISRHIKTLSDALNLQPQEALEKLMRFGLGPSDNSAYQEVVTNMMNSFWQEIQFTLSSFATKETTNPLELLLLFGGGSEIKDMTYFAVKITGVACEQISLTSLFSSSVLYLKNKNHFPLGCVQALATGVPSTITQDVNFRQQEFALSDMRTFTQQFIMGLVLCITLFGILIANYVLQVRTLSHELYESEQEIISEIKDAKFKISADATTVEDVVDEAKTAVNKEETTWFAFSSQSRSSFLKYLLALSTLDKEGLGLEVDNITMQEGTLTMKAKVKDYDALKKLEKDLHQFPKLFRHIPSIEKPDFSATGIRITLAKNSEA